MAFEISDIKKYAESTGHQWYYSIASTKIIKHSPMLAGFNFDAEAGIHYDLQAEIPRDSLKKLQGKKNNEPGSIRIVYPLLKKFLPGEDVDNFILTNLCFFRSMEEYHLSDNDIELCEPLFEELINIVEPKRVIGFSPKVKDYFTSKNLCLDIKSENFKSGKNTLQAVKGYLKIKKTLVPFCILPHPNSRFSTEAIEKAYRYCFVDL